MGFQNLLTITFLRSKDIGELRSSGILTEQKKMSRIQRNSCICSMIMSVVNCSVKMSVWEYERETDIERERAEAVNGIE
jgi:hypothetical protein